MKRVIVAILIVVFLLAWAPWMNDQAIHDQILEEKGKKDGTVIPIVDYESQFDTIPAENLENLIEESRKKGVEEGILICDYNVMWAPFGRWVASCEGGYYVTFYGGVQP